MIKNQQRAVPPLLKQNGNPLPYDYIVHDCPLFIETKTPMYVTE